jgi:hypothetical protein
MNIATQVHFQALVKSFGLTIRLWVIGRAPAQLDIGEFKQLRPKVAGKDTITVRYDSTWKPMQSVDIVEDGFCNPGCCKWVTKSNKVCILGKQIHNDQNAVVRM